MTIDEWNNFMPPLTACPGLPDCNRETPCGDHKDVLKAIRQAVAAERERCAKIAEEVMLNPSTGPYSAGRRAVSYSAEQIMNRIRS